MQKFMFASAVDTGHSVEDTYENPDIGVMKVDFYSQQQQGDMNQTGMHDLAAKLIC